MSNLAVAVSAAADILTVVVELTSRLQMVNASIQKARAAGRDLTDEEMDSIRVMDDAARQRLQKAIDGA